MIDVFANSDGCKLIGPKSYQLWALFVIWPYINKPTRADITTTIKGIAKCLYLLVGSLKITINPAQSPSIKKTACLIKKWYTET